MLRHNTRAELENQEAKNLKTPVELKNPEKNVAISTPPKLWAKGKFIQYLFFVRFGPLFCPAHTQLNQPKILFFSCFYDPKLFEI